MKIDPNTHKPILPGKSVYLSNTQWSALNNFLERLEPDWFEQDESGALAKLFKVSKEAAQ